MATHSIVELPDPDRSGAGEAEDAGPPGGGPIVLREYGEVVVGLDVIMRNGRFDFYPDAVREALFEVRFRGQEVVVKAGHFIGRIAVNEQLIIDVVARVPANNLGRILRVAGQVPTEFERLYREYSLTQEPYPPLLDVFARALVAALRPLESEGIYRRYQRHDETSSFPRGRFLLTETVMTQWSRGRRDRARTSVFEHTTDNGPNRVLKLAVWHLAALAAARPKQKGTTRLLGELNRAYRLFDGVALDTSLACLNDQETLDPTLIPPQRDYYVPAVRLARAIINRQSVEFDRIGEELVLPSLLIDLQTAFEDYTRAVLRQRLTPVHPGLEVLNGKQLEPVGGGKALFDAGSKVPAEPDIVIRVGRGADRFQLVCEVKYIDRDFSREHVNQALAYAVSYRVPVVLIRPCLSHETSGLSKHGEVSGITVYRYLFDLAGQLGDEEQNFAISMRSFLSLTSDISAA